MDCRAIEPLLDVDISVDYPNRPDVLRKMVARLGKQRHRLSFCYEAVLADMDFTVC